MNKKQVLFQQAASAVLFLVVLVMLGWLSTRFKIEADWTVGGRNTLTEASQKQLGSMADPIKFLIGPAGKWFWDDLDGRLNSLQCASKQRGLFWATWG